MCIYLYGTQTRNFEEKDDDEDGDEGRKKVSFYTQKRGPISKINNDIVQPECWCKFH